jgi:SAM-dependent methyltransferase
VNFLPPGYKIRPVPEQFDDHAMPTDVVWQPDVYQLAAAFADTVGASRIVDLGCGTGAKLLDMPDRFELVGVDLAWIVERCTDDRAEWVGCNIEEDPWPSTPSSVIVASDVIEHLTRPVAFLVKIGHALDQGARGAVLSTPERDLTRGYGDLGPPANPAHVCEWNAAEFAQLCTTYVPGTWTFDLTRSSTLSQDRHTIFATVFR